MGIMCMAAEPAPMTATAMVTASVWTEAACAIAAMCAATVPRSRLISSRGVGASLFYQTQVRNARAMGSTVGRTECA